MMRAARFLVFIIILTLLHFSFLSFYPESKGAVNVFILASLYFTVTAGLRAGILLCIFGGMLFELQSLTPAGVWIGSGALTVSLLAFVLIKYVTNHSAFSLALLTAAGTMVWNILFWGGSTALGFFHDPSITVSTQFLAAGLLQVPIHGISIGIVLALRRGFSHRFLPDVFERT